MKVKLILLIAFIGLSISLHAQSSKLFSTDMELSNSLVNQVYQDRNGIIWIATEDGLNRYDGSKFSIYRNEDKNPNSPLHNYVRSFLEDSRGNFYIGYFAGLQCYDRATDTYTKIPLMLQIGGSFDAYISTMIERKNGQILIATSGHGIFELVYEKDSLYARQIMVEDPSVAVVTMMEDKDENLWVSTDDKGLFRINKNNGSKIFFSGNTTPQIISSICQDKTETIYAGSMSTGLYKLDTSTDSFVSIPYTDPQLPVKTLYVNQNNEILIGTDGSGLKVYRPGEAQIGDESFNVMTFDFSKSKVHSILEDENKNIWLGIFQKGVMLLPARSGGFEYIGYKSIVKNLIGSNCIMSLYKDREGTMWVGTDSDGVYGISPDGKSSVHFSHSRQPNSVPSTIMCIFEDSNHNLWLGSYLHGLAKLNRKTGQCQYISGVTDKGRFPIQRVYSITEDDNKNLWLGTHGGGLYQMDIATHTVKPYNEESTNNRINRWINSVLKARTGWLHVGTHDGLYSIDLKTQRTVFNYQNHILPRQVIYTLYEDSKGLLWIGTSQGLTSYDPKNSIIVTYTINDGLPSNVICAIQEDKEGDLWISTNSGISHFNPQERRFTNYYANDGLQGNEFSKNASYEANGKLYFAGLNGITYFKPEEITIPEKELQVRLTDFYIHDQPVKKGMKSGPYEITDTSVMEAGSFHLAHNDNSFTIEFATNEFSNPERITYSYSINNNHWISLRPGTNRVSFNNLAPGKYKFKIMAQDFNIQSDVKEIHIHISPAWYLSLWAKSLYWLIGFLFIFLIALQIRQRYKARQKYLEHLHAQEINEAKLQFFINVSHEIRTPMSLVMSPLKKLMNTDKDCERQKAYSIMNRNIDRVLNLINQLMDIRKIDKGQMSLRFQEVDMVQHLKDSYTFFEEMAKEKRIDFQFHHNTEHLNAWIDLRNFDKVIINVLSNAFKFTPEDGEIMIYLNALENHQATGKSGDNLEIIISDNGIGIDENETEHIFERFYQAKKMLTKSYEGTGIGLHLARSIMELHHGTIRAENNIDGKGSRFIIHLPLGNEHLKAEEIESEQAGPINEHKDQPIIPSIIEPEAEGVKIKSKSKRHVLVVDDDKDIREYICRELSPDYHMTECSNGKEALDAIFRKIPDLVISDVMMPEMDGITLCQKIKQNININHVPVILLTARSKEEDNLEGLDIGADAYMVKPFNIEILKKTAQNIIKNREMLRNSFTGSQQQKDKISKITIKSSDDKLLERIMKVINKNIANPEFNVEMISTEVGISRVHLHRKLKELTNQSTRDLIRNIRLQQAAELLSNQKLTVGEVAAATGFSNLTHFSTAFKEAYGMSPVSYMEMHLNERTNIIE